MGFARAVALTLVPGGLLGLAAACGEDPGGPDPEELCSQDNVGFTYSCTDFPLVGIVSKEDADRCADTASCLYDAGASCNAEGSCTVECCTSQAAACLPGVCP